MRKLMYMKRGMMMAFVGVALVGCGTPEGGPSPATTAEPTAATAQLTKAQQMAAANTKADADAHLLTRKYLGADEVVEFYEPVPGHILVSAAGSPSGASAVHPEQLMGKTAREAWTAVAPGEALPAALSDAIARSEGDIPKTPIDQAAAEPTRASGGDAPVAAAAPIVKAAVKPLATGYCASQFWTDWGNWGGGNPTDSKTLNWGWNYDNWTNVTGTAGYIVCPQGDVSGTGGTLTINFPNGTSSSWQVNPNYYRWQTWAAGANCGWDVSCWAAGLGNRCTPVAFGIYGKFESQCYLTKGTSCGDNYDWLTWASSAGSWCETPNFN